MPSVQFSAQINRVLRAKVSNTKPSPRLSLLSRPDLEQIRRFSDFPAQNLTPPSLAPFAELHDSATAAPEEGQDGRREFPSFSPTSTKNLDPTFPFPRFLRPRDQSKPGLVRGRNFQEMNASSGCYPWNCEPKIRMGDTADPKAGGKSVLPIPPGICLESAWNQGSTCSDFAEVSIGSAGNSFCP